MVSAALARLDAVQCPVLHLYRHKELGFVMRHTGAEFVIVPGEWKGFDFTAMAQELAEAMDPSPTVLSVEALVEGDPSTLPPAPTYPDGDEPVRWIYSTSGTTSDPKGVLHTDATLIAGGRGLADALQMTADDVGSIAFPYAHIAGPDYLVMMLLTGMSAVIVEAFMPADAIELLPSQRGHHGRRSDRVLPDVPRRAALAAGRTDHPHAAGAVGRRCAAAAGAVPRGARRDGHQDLPRVRHDRDPDDHPGVARPTPTTS